MGLTASSTGRAAIDKEFEIEKNGDEKIVALVGNPNVGKSVMFNELTGMKQHTGNWPGKTISSAQGRHTFKGQEYILVDLPGAYSLSAHSAEEEVTRDFLCFGKPDVAIVVCDATCLERNLNLALQTISIIKNTVVCVNLMDEAKKRNIKVNLKALSEKLGVPVVGTVARSGKGLDKLFEEVEKTISQSHEISSPVVYSEQIVNAVEPLIRHIQEKISINAEFIALRLLEEDTSIENRLRKEYGSILFDKELEEKLRKARLSLLADCMPIQAVRDEIISAPIRKAEEIANETVKYGAAYERDRKLDRILTGKKTGIPIMLLLLGVIFWITIVGANYPSELLSTGLFWIQDRLTKFFAFIGAPNWLTGALIDGVYRTVAWVVSVMLPPMAIFFPLFTLLEDFGYLPRVAFNLDHSFKKAGACGKQALTTCMGFGCNAAGIVGCRIIDSPRERLIAMLTNNFVPCNGRFPTIIALITMFFSGVFVNAWAQSLVSALLLLVIIVLGVLTTLLISRILSHTILKGLPSSFTLELPPYRKPQIGKVIVRSIFDRTLFVLGRAVIVAAPAGLLLWILANVAIGDISLLQYVSDFLDPFATIFGMDGVILTAFILGFPANEIVVPIMIMIYMSQGALVDYSTLDELKGLLVANGWTFITALSTILFSLMHWPCSTACLTIKKESGSIKWTVAAFLIPTIVGLTVCFIVSNVLRLLGVLL